MTEKSMLEHFERTLQTLCSDERIRTIESGHGDALRLWREVDALGFTDALLPAEAGGAGLSLADVGALVSVAARAGLPHPLGETMLARFVLHQAGERENHACIVLACTTGDELACSLTSAAQLAQQALVLHNNEWWLLPMESAVLTPSPWRPHISASLRWPSDTRPLQRLSAAASSSQVRALMCAIQAAALSGAIERVMALSVQYANDRKQFGQPVGQFQAVQQDLAVMAEQAAFAAMAARMACTAPSSEPFPNSLLAATGKLSCSQAALLVANLAHAVHGAIGITQEHLLGSFTRRLHEWRNSGNGEHDCALAIGSALLASDQAISPFVQQSLHATPVQEA